MRPFLLALAAIFALAVSAPMPAAAQGTETETPTTTKPRRTTKPKRELTVGQMAARERQKKCGVEWKEAKAKKETGGLKWPQYYSKCNARLKGSQV
ncbi:hypothetical protein [uncultured Enterovirga sp.]|uniref:hypothetical protein n=1 Tax=uncultured Enterovirga sp. TaxID=2026352 RepID=UPI0035CB7283